MPHDGQRPANLGRRHRPGIDSAAPRKPGPCPGASGRWPNGGHGVGGQHHPLVGPGPNASALSGHPAVPAAHDVRPQYCPDARRTLPRHRQCERHALCGTSGQEGRSLRPDAVVTWGTATGKSCGRRGSGSARPRGSELKWPWRPSHLRERKTGFADGLRVAMARGYRIPGS